MKYYEKKIKVFVYISPSFDVIFVSKSLRMFSMINHYNQLNIHI